MKIDKAIETNREHAKEHDKNVNQDYFRALNLGIEALKRLQQLRLSKITWFRGPLPGETEE